MNSSTDIDTDRNFVVSGWHDFELLARTKKSGLLESDSIPSLLTVYCAPFQVQSCPLSALSRQINGENESTHERYF
jgi:hypothetical protein